MLNNFGKGMIKFNKEVFILSKKYKRKALQYLQISESLNSKNHFFFKSSKKFILLKKNIITIIFMIILEKSMIKIY
jgi:hypothetical protein